MVYTGVTSILNNNVPNNIYNGKTSIGYRVRSCDTNLNSNTPANQYQRLKLICNTVRTQSSNYTMNLESLTAYEKPSNRYQPIYLNGSYYVASPGVNWNQMSDRAYPHTQVAVTSSGSTYHSSSTKRSIVRNRPGSLSPGGTGCDIKHNSYERYLNRIKGKGPLRRGVIPPTFGSPIPYNRAYPVYGGKVTKPNIVSGCDCVSKIPSSLLYENPNYAINNVVYNFSVGDKVYVYNNNVKVVAEILAINGINYTLKLSNGNIAIFPVEDLLFYCSPKCVTSENQIITDLEASCILPESDLFLS